MKPDIWTAEQIAEAKRRAKEYIEFFGVRKRIAGKNMCVVCSETFFGEHDCKGFSKETA